MTIEPRPAPRRRRRGTSAQNALTLREVAKAAGVSVASASRALTRPDLVSEQLKGQVEHSARALGYIPNAAAQALSGRPRRLVGVVLGGLDDRTVASMLDAMAACFAAHDIALLVATGADSEIETAKRVRDLVGRGAGAMLFGAGARPIRPPEAAAMNRLPWASLDATDVEQRIDTASGFDRARAHALAVRYLRELGHRRVALLAPGGARHVAAVRAALGETDVVLADLVAPVEGARGVADRMSQLLAPPAPTTALVCGSDTIAARVLDECERQGVAVPQQLSIVGFGDAEWVRHTRPTLTTVRIPAQDAGIAAAEFVLARLEGRPAATGKLSVKLIARESSGPAPA